MKRPIYIHYSDCLGYGATRHEAYKIGPYDIDRAAVIAANLETMGCYDIHYEDVIDTKEVVNAEG